MWRRGRKRGSGAADEPSDAAAGGSVSLPYDASAGASPSATVSLNVLPEVLTMIDASAEGIRADEPYVRMRLMGQAAERFMFHRASRVHRRMPSSHFCRAELLAGYRRHSSFARSINATNACGSWPASTCTRPIERSTFCYCTAFTR